MSDNYDFIGIDVRIRCKFALYVENWKFDHRIHQDS